MKLSIAVEMDGNLPQSGMATFLVSTGDDPQQPDLPFRISANFVAQLAATFLQTPQTRPRQRIEWRDAIRIYDDAVAPRPMSPGTKICCKT
jgi:hypothetical protein